MDSVFDLRRQHHDVDSKIVAALERLSQAHRVLLWRENHTHNLSPIQIQMLVHLLFHRDAPVTIGALAREFSLTPATISDAVASLARKKLVLRTKAKADQRQILITLTAAGEEAARSLAGWANVLYEQVAALDGSDKVVVMQFLMKLIEGLQRAGVITVTRMCLTCSNFQVTPEPDAPSLYFCALMQKPLPVAELRFDCPEHMAREAG